MSGASLWFQNDVWDRISLRPLFDIQNFTPMVCSLRVRRKALLKTECLALL